MVQTVQKAASVTSPTQTDVTMLMVPATVRLDGKGSVVTLIPKNVLRTKRYVEATRHAMKHQGPIAVFATQGIQWVLMAFAKVILYTLE